MMKKKKKKLLRSLEQNNGKTYNTTTNPLLLQTIGAVVSEQLYDDAIDLNGQAERPLHPGAKVLNVRMSLSFTHKQS